MGWAFEGDEGLSFSALVLTADTNAPQVAATMYRQLTARPSTGYTTRVFTSFDVTGTDLVDDINRAAASVPERGYTLCYVSGRHQLLADDIVVAGPPPTTLSQVLTTLLHSSSPFGLLVLVDHYGEGDGLHAATVGALARASIACPWCLISEAVDVEVIDPTHTPLLEALGHGLGDEGPTHTARWFRAADLHRQGSRFAADRGLTPPMMTATASVWLPVGFVERAPTGPEFDERLELALSGGGYRASAFSLGSLLYLVHSGLNKRVDSIVSVSGGSITNAWIAQTIDYAKLNSAEEFAPCAQGLASHLCRTSLVSLKNVYFALWLALLVAAVVFAGTRIVADWPLSRGDLPVLVATVLAAAVVIQARGHVVTRWLARNYCRSAQYQRIGDLADRTVDHVIAATDLCTGEPFCMSGRSKGRTFSPTWGLRPGRSVRLSTAVRASTALPPLMPPVRLKLESWPDQVGEPRAIWLTDGGIWNNLGTDWSRFRSEILSAEWTRISNAEGVTAAIMAADGAAPSGGVRLVIDASAPLIHRRMRTLWIPVLSTLDTALRAMLTSYASTVAARRPALTAARDRMILNPERWHVDWPQPPMTWNETPGSSPPLELIVGMVGPGEIADNWTSSGLGTHWDQIGASYRAELSQAEQELARIRGDRPKAATTLNGLGTNVVLQLVVDGYLATRETLVTAFENHSAPAIPDTAWFDRMIGLRDSG